MKDATEFWLLATEGSFDPASKGYWLPARQRDRDLAGDRRFRTDWKFVEAHLFNANGKWKYQAWLDYTNEWKPADGRTPGLDEQGWHFDGHAMALRALHAATGGGTSGVTFKKLPEGWSMFVLGPPQGYPHWVRSGDQDTEE